MPDELDPAAATPPTDTTTAPPPASNTTDTTPAGQNPAGETPPPDKTGGGSATPPAKQASFLNDLKDNTGSEGDGDNGGKGGEDGSQGGDPEYAFTYADGFTRDEEAEAGLVSFAKENSLPPEKAQALMGMHQERLRMAHSRMMEERATANNQWLAELRSAPDYARLQENAAMAVKKFADPGLLEILEAANLGSHPAVVRTLANFGKTLREGGRPKDVAAPPAQPTDIVGAKQAVLDEVDKKRGK